MPSMMKVTTEDGLRFEGRSAKQVVKEMERAQWQQYDTKHEYMEAVAERVESMTGTRPRVSSAAHFVNDLVSIGLLIPA